MNNLIHLYVALVGIVGKNEKKNWAGSSASASWDTNINLGRFLMISNDYWPQIPYGRISIKF